MPIFIYALIITDLVVGGIHSVPKSVAGEQMKDMRCMYLHLKMC